MVAVQVASMVRSTSVGRNWSLCVTPLMGAAVEECASQRSRMAERGRSDMVLLRLPGQVWGRVWGAALVRGCYMALGCYSPPGRVGYFMGHNRDANKN